MASRALRMIKVAENVRPYFESRRPGWNRLEPQSVSGDPAPGCQARIHDPCWALARQWQLGEFQGEDAGTPISVDVTYAAAPVTSVRTATGERIPLAPGEPLEPAVESVPASPPGLRQRAEAGAQLQAMLADAGLAADGLLAGHPLEYDDTADPHDAAGRDLFTQLHDLLPDGEKIAAALESGNPPPALASAAASPVAAEWLRWYRGATSPDCWADDRFEYRFGIDAGGHAMAADGFAGGRVDWYHFSAADRASDPAEFTPPAHRRMLATPLTFPGMPASRYWEFEDGRVNLGALGANRRDLARLLLAEFAIVYDNDWLLAPLDVPWGSLTVLGEVSYTTNFGDTIPVPPAGDDRFSMFRIDGVRGLLIPPAVPAVIDGPPAEEVLFLRDELDNLAWAVERIVQAPGGDPRPRTDEPGPPPETEPGTEDADLDYRLNTGVPDWWIPLVPVSTGPHTIELRKGAMIAADGTDIHPRGRLLRPGERLSLRDEEVPREGRQVRRVPTLARTTDGTLVRWTAHRVGIGRGEGTSHLAFDTAIPRHS